jgi:hypothetical protein
MSILVCAFEVVAKAELKPNVINRKKILIMFTKKFFKEYTFPEEK